MKPATSKPKSPKNTKSKHPGKSPNTTAAKLVRKKPTSPEKQPDITCCVLCHAAVDYADRAAFFQPDRQALLDDKDIDEVLPNLLLPSSLYDPYNTLVFCDTCNRTYHQRCHFVPLLTLPRGDWHCLLCQSPSTKKTTATTPTKGRTTTNDLYRHTFGDKELQWEAHSIPDKLQAMEQTLQRFKKSLSQQLQQIRLAQATLNAHTRSRTNTSNGNNTKSNLQLLLKSQEVYQSFYKLANAKRTVRQWLQSMQQYIEGTTESKSLPMLMNFCQDHQEEETFWFPFGRDLERRVVYKFDSPTIPFEITCLHDNTVPNDKANEDDDDMISLDDLKCCVCFIGDATDDNDVLLCDGHGCFRAYHMKCVKPAISTVDEDEDWFCPLCTAMANMMEYVQTEYVANDREENHTTESVCSWDHPNEVFPESEQEYEVAMKWKEGNVTGEDALFLARHFGVEGAVDVILEANEDEEDQDDDDFDLNESNKEDDETKSHDGSLHDLSSVELNISKCELDALSAGSSPPRRRIRSNDNDDVGALRKSNIIRGKRRRRNVDYKCLNDAMFGALKEDEMHHVDDAEDFELVPKRTDSNDFDSSDEDSTRSSAEGDDENSTDSANVADYEAAHDKMDERPIGANKVSESCSSGNGYPKSKRTTTAMKRTSKKQQTKKA